MGKGAQTREAILVRSLSLASHLGLEGVTIGRLAEELDLSKSGLFAHFRSKEELQLQTLQRAADEFVEAVVKPALAVPRGERRVRALFEGWLRWPEVVPQPGGCIFVAAAVELDDRPGPARELLVRLQRDWLDVIATTVRAACSMGEFRRDVDPEQFAYEVYGIMLVCHHATRLLRDPKATERAEKAFTRLVGAARARR